MEQNRITLDDLDGQNILIRSVFLARFPRGATVEELKNQAEAHGWIGRLLADLGVA